MTIETRNEAADRLLNGVGGDYPSHKRWLAEALAFERRATVERIRAAYSAGIVRPEIAERDRVLAILDEEAR